MEGLSEKLSQISAEIQQVVRFLDLDAISEKISELEAMTASDSFWSDQNRAKKITTDLSHLTKKRDFWASIIQRHKDLTDIVVMYENESGISESEQRDIRESVEKLEIDLKKSLLEVYMSGQYDNGPAILSIYSGAGGVDAQDFASILLRMYLRYCESKGFDAEVFQKTEGEVGGIKSVSVRITGELAYGYLKTEKGVHRLVRLSPFNSGGTRETSFALVEVVPEIEVDGDDIVIEDKDIRIDTYRASGAGGQHVNKTDSAVRLTHLPTGIVVACQSERSQHQNKERAFNMLRGKIASLLEEQQVKKIDELRGDLGKNEWGHQIRSYVIHPYKMVKDLRTGYETSQVEKVLDGEIDELIEASLSNKEK